VWWRSGQDRPASFPGGGSKVPVSPRLLAVLQKHKEAGKAKGVPWLFPSPKGCRCATKPGWASSLHARVRGSEVELALRPAGALLVQLEPANTEAQAPNWSQFAVSVSRQVAIRGKTWRLDASTEQQACAEDGSARFEGVPGGSAYVQAYDRDGLFWASGSFDVNVQTLNTIKLTPRPRLRPLAVTVCDEHGKRIAGAEIRMTFGGERFAQRTDGDGHVSVVVSGVANMRSPSGQYGSICGWHPDVGQGVMAIHGDVLAGGATLVLRRVCSVGKATLFL
jgi:hypothetical protein